MNIRDASPSLFNEDLAPATDKRWGVFSIFNVWTSDVHSLWGYYLAASLFLMCGSFFNFVLAIGLGSLVIYALMNLIGYAGERTGVPYPVLARASFGVWGANLPALVRAVVACFWYGAQTAAASRGFLYAASLMGVTGARAELSAAGAALVKRVRATTDLPVGVGLK